MFLVIVVTDRQTDRHTHTHKPTPEKTYSLSFARITSMCIDAYDASSVAAGLVCTRHVQCLQPDVLRLSLPVQRRPFYRSDDPANSVIALKDDSLPWSRANPTGSAH